MNTRAKILVTVSLLVICCICFKAGTVYAWNGVAERDAELTVRELRMDSYLEQMEVINDKRMKAADVMIQKLEVIEKSAAR